MGRMIVVETSSLPLEKQIKVKAEEISAIELLIKKRDEWLRKDHNKKRSTFAAVAADTNQMRGNLSELREELRNLVSNFQLSRQ